MGLAFTQYTASGGENQYAIAFPYLEESDITVSLDGADEAFTFSTSTEVDITSGNPANGVIVEVLRTTNRNTREVDYQNGTNLGESTMDLDSNQLFYVMQEGFDLVDKALKLNSSGVYDGGDIKIDGVGNLDDFTSTYDDFAMNLEMVKSYFAANVASAGVIVVDAFWRTILDESNLAASLTAMGFPTLIKSFLAETTQAGMSSAINSKGIDVASTAGVMTLGTDGNHYTVTGTNAITGIATQGAGTQVTIETTGACSFVNSATLILGGAANIQAAAGDVFVFVETETAATWRLVSYSLTSGKSLIRNTPTTTRGDMVFRGASVDLRLAVGATAGLRLGTDGTDPVWEENPLPRSYFTGFLLLTGSDAAHDFNVKPGVCRDAANTKNCSFPTEFTKKFDVNFAEGSAAGGMATGIALPQSGTVHFFVAEKDAAPGTFDIIGDTSVTMANGVTGWTMRRRIGSRITDATSPGNFVATTQFGDDVTLDTLPEDVATANPGTSRVTAALSVPIDLVLEASFHFTLRDTTGSSSTYAIITSLADTDSTPAIGLANISVPSNGGGDTGNGYTLFRIRTDTSGQIGYRTMFSDSAVTARILTQGWTDRRGKDD